MGEAVLDSDVEVKVLVGLALVVVDLLLVEERSIDVLLIVLLLMILLFVALLVVLLLVLVVVLLCVYFEWFDVLVLLKVDLAAVELADVDLEGLVLVALLVFKMLRVVDTELL